MSEHRAVHIEEANLSIAWAKAFLALMADGCSEITPLTVTVTGIQNGRPNADDPLQQLLDSVLVRHGESSCNTVANTIFPRSLWNPSKEASFLYERYIKHAWPRIKHCPANYRGTYFQRMIAFDDGKRQINQIDHVIKTWRGKNHRHSALQLSIFDPRRDHTHCRQMGFPCLHQVSLTPLGANGRDGLAITGFYATQHIFAKAYGNYVGLCRLGEFVAHELGLSLRRMTCIAAVARMGNTRKDDLQPLRKRAEQIVDKLEKDTKKRTL